MSKGTTSRNIRIDDDRWERLQVACDKVDTNASALIRAMVDVYLEGVEEGHNPP